MSNFSAFKNREKISESLKYSRRQTLLHKKANLIEQASSAVNGQIQLPKLSSEEEIKVKDSIKKNITKARRKKDSVFTVVFLLVLIILILLSKKYNVF